MMPEERLPAIEADAAHDFVLSTPQIDWCAVVRELCEELRRTRCERNITAILVAASARRCGWTEGMNLPPWGYIETKARGRRT